jgi:hypothetical protein
VYECAFRFDSKCVWLPRVFLGHRSDQLKRKEGTEVRTVGLQTALSVVVHFYGVDYVESRIIGLRHQFHFRCYFS